MVCDVSGGMSKVASDRRPPEKTMLQLQRPDESQACVSNAQLRYKCNLKWFF